MISHDYRCCYQCCYWQYDQNRCTNPRSLFYGNGQADDAYRTPCPLYASQSAAFSRLPKRKKWTKIKSIYDAELPNSRWI